MPVIRTIFQNHENDTLMVMVGAPEEGAVAFAVGIVGHECPPRTFAMEREQLVILHNTLSLILGCSDGQG